MRTSAFVSASQSPAVTEVSSRPNSRPGLEVGTGTALDLGADYGNKWVSHCHLGQGKPENQVSVKWNECPFLDVLT